MPIHFNVGRLVGRRTGRHVLHQSATYLVAFTESGGFVSKHLGDPLGDPGNPLLSTGRSDPLIS